MMETKTASKIKLFLVQSQEPNRELYAGSINTLTGKPQVKKELARLDQEAQELINQILEIVEDG